MRRIAFLLFIFPAVAASPLFAQDIVFIGEVHDNPAHHAFQAEEVVRLKPKALVFEMLTAEQAARLKAGRPQDPEALSALLDWQDSGWPDFALYAPIFAAAPDAAIFGAGLPRGQARALAGLDPRESFGPDADAYGLTEPLDEAEEAAREELQFEAHCAALPREALPGMVALQRLRDAYLARSALRALAAEGAPVIVITGNGHARRDWGAPALVARAMPGLDILTIGQGEDGQAPAGAFDLVRDAPGVDRPDPCEAFR